ncbi:uncharacterized protein LAJ45_01166 [Morchella importuna]|uniref:uncharacterized protein n=1 Tax=Morchella importuna TaxID=1174673 RepID=UPI001E8D1392|nr:uncharacterized protein LAJ45_01166 [Morchella importuna]KAH8154638.1 hypothetical protein LAJ45_01166 [Morchella importuna]
MPNTKPRRQPSAFERELNSEIRALRKVHNGNNNRLRHLYNYIHGPRPSTGISLASFLMARAHLPTSEYPDEATMAKNAIAEILEIQSKIPALQKDYDRLLSHRSALRAQLEDEERDRGLEGQMVDNSNCGYEEHHHLLNSTPAEEETLHQAFIAGDYSVSSDFAAMPGPFEDPFPASNEQYQEPPAVLTAEEWHMAMMLQTELGIEWTPNGAQSESAGEQASANDGPTHENGGDTTDFDTMRQLLETFPDQEVGMMELLNA